MLIGLKNLDDTVCSNVVIKVCEKYLGLCVYFSTILKVIVIIYFTAIFPAQLTSSVIFLIMIMIFHILQES